MRQDGCQLSATWRCFSETTPCFYFLAVLGLSCPYISTLLDNVSHGTTMQVRCEPLVAFVPIGLRRRRPGPGARGRANANLQGVTSCEDFVELPVLSCLGLTLGLLLLPAGEANADLSVNNIGLYAGGSTPINPNATIVEIQYTGNSGVWVYGDAQTATNWTYPKGSFIPVYCIDLVHDNYLGSSYNLAAWTDPNSFSSDALNRVAWAAENASLAGFGPAAAQLLMWSVIDPKFKVLNWNGDSCWSRPITNSWAQ